MTVMYQDNQLAEATSAKSYVSRSGFRMWGGSRSVPAMTQATWLSLGLFAGVAIAITTYLALRG